MALRTHPHGVACPPHWCGIQSDISALVERMSWPGLRRPPLAPLRDPMVASDVGTASAQRRRAPHRHHRLALATRLTARREIPPRVGLPAAEPLVHETLLGAGIV